MRHQWRHQLCRQLRTSSNDAEAEIDPRALRQTIAKISEAITRKIGGAHA